MEEVAKDNGHHRPSVSMPSLDSTDDFPTNTTASESTESAFVNTDSFVSAASTESVSALKSAENPSDELPTLSCLADSAAEGNLSIEDTQTNDELTAETLIQEPSAENINPEPELTDNSEPQLNNEPSTSELLQSDPTGNLIDSQTDLPQEGLDESQAEEDPSIAIDQFIKKIADEQLSSKRIEEREEEEAQAEGENDKNLNIDQTKEAVSENVNEIPAEITESLTVNPPTSESSLLNDSVLNTESTQNDEVSDQLSSLENTLTDNNSSPVKEPENKTTEMEKPEPMEVDEEVISEPPLKVESEPKTDAKIIKAESAEVDEPMQAESIEEIQKEIDKMPPKKAITNNEGLTKPSETCTQNGKASLSLPNSKSEPNVEENIEKILGGDLEAPKVGGILKTVLEKQLKVPTIEDSAEVAKDKALLELAQEEIKKLDVLVCGQCHNTFYFMQEFVDHKKGNCNKKSVLSGVDGENKAQVWGFILWKTKQIRNLGDGDKTPSSWAIYEKWCKLPQVDQNAWITAGQSVQYASRIANSKVTEIKTAKPVKQAAAQKVPEKGLPPLGFKDSNKENSSMDMENSTSNFIKRVVTKPVKLNNDVTIMPSTKTASATSISEASANKNTAIRTTKVDSAQKDEFVVEKIMAKRFNPRKKTWEYNIKWANFGHEANTWEPISNLSHCKKLLEQFEEQLRRMKEEKEKAKQAAMSPLKRGRPSNPKPIKTGATNFVPIAPKTSIAISNVVGGVTDDYAGGSSHRPQRSSKQKAMNQVKQWCGNISDEDAQNAAIKRKFETDDSDEDFDDKKIKLEEDSEDSDNKEVKPKISIKKVSTPVSTKSTPAKVQINANPVKNGKAPAGVLPSNILIPDANGVVRINQKQLPALSSGVYIMSKTAGIIKLDSTTSKVATSGGQTIVKVAPKIGQTQIKIVKKDGNTTKQIIQVAPKGPVTSTPGKMTPAMKARLTPKIRKEIKRATPIGDIPRPLPKKIEPPVTLKKPEESEESDDGLEPLPFPEPDEPIPSLEEEEKQEEFTLDPETGKLAGVEYVDKPVVIKEEPQPQPPTTNELENIVKMAAAEISEDDLHTNSDSHDDSLFMDNKKEIFKTKVKVEPKPIEPTPIVKKTVKYTVGGQVIKTETSPMVTKPTVQAQRHSLSASQKPMLQRRPIASQPQPQRILNQSVSQRMPGQQTRTVVRHVIEPTRPSQSGNINVIRKTVTSTGATRNRYSMPQQKPMSSPLQPTRTYSAMGGIRQGPTSSGNKVHVYSTKVPSSGSQVQPGIRKIGQTVVRAASSHQGARPQAQQYVQQQKPMTRIVQRVVSSPKKPIGQQVVTSSAAQVVSKPVSPIKPKTVINMPSLTEDDTPVSPTKLQQKLQQPKKEQQTVPKATQPVIKQEEPAAIEPAAAPQTESAESGATAADQADWSSFTMADGENPIYVTGDDGTIYQVAGQNEQGQTILITQGADGQQQCLLVTNEIGEMAPDEPQPSTSAAATTIAEAAVVENVNIAVSEAQESDLAVPTSIATNVDESLQTPLQIKTDTSEMEGIEDGVQDQVVAQVVRAEPPSPGGTHKVVVMLPDGNLMVTQVSPEEYASLELE